MINRALWEVSKPGDLLDVIYVDYETGDEFFVELEKQEGETMEQFLARADMIARENFDEPERGDLIDFGKANVLGYDTY